MKDKKSAHVEISGHTDNVDNPRRNTALSKSRGPARRRYLISTGIADGRIRAAGHGDERSGASNGTEERRQLNRRIEAAKL